MRVGVYNEPSGRVWDPGLLVDDGLIRVWALHHARVETRAFFMQPNTVGYWEGQDVDHLNYIGSVYTPEHFSNAWHVRRFADTYYAYFSECERHDGARPDHRMCLATSQDGLVWVVSKAQLGYRGYESKEGFKGELDPFVVEHKGVYWLFLRVTGITWGLEPQILCGRSDSPMGPWKDMKPVLGESITGHFGETERFTVYRRNNKWRLVFGCWRKYVDEKLRRPSNYSQWVAEADTLDGTYELVAHSMPMPYGYGVAFAQGEDNWVSGCWRFLKEGAMAEMILAEHAEDPRP